MPDSLFGCIWPESISLCSILTFGCGFLFLLCFTFPFHFHALEKEMATHSSVLAWRIQGTGEPGGLPSGITQLGMTEAT